MLTRSCLRHSSSSLFIIRGLQLVVGELIRCPFSSAAVSPGAGPSPGSAGPVAGNRPSAPATLDTATIAALSTLEKKKPASIKPQQVPSSRAGRALVFGSLALHLGWDRLTKTNPNGMMISSEGHERIAATLCRMRGALLKLGQMLSIQDEKTVPAAVTQVFERVRDSAFSMPPGQLEQAMRDAYGSQWAMQKENGETLPGSLFSRFDMEPVAAASIGQVHRAVLRRNWQEAVASTLSQPSGVSPRQLTDTGCSDEDVVVAVKVQYPGVASSIDADVANLRMLISLNLLPKGMFVENILKELRQELSLECRYLVEAQKQERYRELISADVELSKVFVVPKVFKELCRDNVLVTEFVRGVNIDVVAKVSDPRLVSVGAGGSSSAEKTSTLAAIPQAYKNHLAHHLMLLTLKELFVWRFMQTDPNFSNFLFDPSSGKINLLDFGAAREYEQGFIRDYLDVVAAAAMEDRATIIAKSIALGFLTGQESKEMLDAHCSSVIILGKPFRKPRERGEVFDFSKEHLPSQIQAHVPTMLRLRLKPPPTAIYSLHRRLSGTILLCTKLGASISSGDIFWDIYDACQ
jgi:aarF domain-containing kinase